LLNSIFEIDHKKSKKRNILDKNDQTLKTLESIEHTMDSQQKFIN